MQFYAMEIFLGIEVLHSSAITFRDLKPENVLIRLNGHALLTDMGLARERADDAKHRSMLGTPEYIAPEIIKNLGEFGAPLFAHHTTAHHSTPQTVLPTVGYDEKVDFWA